MLSQSVDTESHLDGIVHIPVQISQYFIMTSKHARFPEENEYIATEKPSESAHAAKHAEQGSALPDLDELVSREASDNASDDLERPGTYDKIEITEDDCYDELGYRSRAGRNG